MAKKKISTNVDIQPLNIKNLEFVREQAQHFLQEMRNHGLGVEDIAPTLNDFVKLILLTLVTTDHMSGIDVCMEFVQMSSDVTECIMKLTMGSVKNKTSKK